MPNDVPDVKGDCPPCVRGITLVELLVVISILLLMMAVAARMMRFSGGDRQTREAARAINVFFASARARATELGRPCGVMLRSLENRPTCVVGLDQVEVPPPYAGDTLEAVAKVQVTSSPGSDVATLSAIFSLSGFSDGLVREHDQIQLNYQGPWYEITGGRDTDGDGFFDFGLPEDIDKIDTDGDNWADNPDTYRLVLQLDVSQGQMLPWSDTAWSAPMAYQIIRRPAKSATSGLQLPARTVIDLESSGTNDHSIGDEIAEHPGEPLCFMFSPSGSLDRVYHGGHGHRGTEQIFLMVGKLERMPAGAAEDGLTNWQDLTNVWMTINPQTGMLTTSQVDKGATLYDSRALARAAEHMGGR